MAGQWWCDCPTCSYMELCAHSLSVMCIDGTNRLNSTKHSHVGDRMVRSQPSVPACSS